MATEAKPLVIGVNVNENTMRDMNPHVPWSSAEIAATAAQCEAAGASLVHFHARTVDGAAEHSAEAYAAVIRAINQKCSLVLAPSMANVPGYDVTNRLSNIVPNQSDRATRSDLLAVDMGCANMDLFDASVGEFTTDDRVFVNDVRSQTDLIGWAEKLQMRPYLASFNLSWTRAILAHVEAGRLSGPVLIAFVLGGPEFVAAHPVTENGLESHLALIPPELDVEWVVSAYRGNVLEIADRAISLGGHVAIGTGDHHHRDLGSPTSAELVERVADIGRRHGRPCASTDQARSMFGLENHEPR
jgi:3-keto-5-aminohexanoate cleavage enzyme